MIYMVFDNPADKQNMTFLKENETASIRQIYPIEKCSTMKKILTVTEKCIKKTEEDDTIIFWYDFMAVLCWWLCKFQGKNRKIIVLNILLKNKDTVKNSIAKFMYKQVLSSDKVRATVTSKKYGEYLNEMLGIHKNYTLLHDIYHCDYRIDFKGEVGLNTVFCGGRNGRDWRLLIEIAQAMPDVIFNCVMPKDKFEQYKENMSKNMVVKSEVSEKEFIDFLCQSRLVVMPLDTEAPAGLIVFFQAAANQKMIITSKTVVTQEYFADGRGALCENNVEDWKNKIENFLHHATDADDCTKKFKEFLENECSEGKYAKTLWGMLD